MSNNSLLSILALFEGVAMFDSLDDLPPDPERCKSCKYHPSNLALREDEQHQHCYMFLTIPESLCMQYDVR